MHCPRFSQWVWFLSLWTLAFAFTILFLPCLLKLRQKIMCTFSRYRASCETTFLISSFRDNGCDIEFTSSSSLITFPRGYNGSCVALGIEEHGFLSNDQRWQHASHDTRKFRNRSMIEKLSEKCNASPAANFYTGGREDRARRELQGERRKQRTDEFTGIRQDLKEMQKVHKTTRSPWQRYFYRLHI